MATYILRLSGTEIIGARNAIDGAVIPGDSISVSEQLFNDYSTLKAQMRADGRRDNPHYINDAVVIPDDERAIIDASIANSNVKLDEFANITITRIDIPNWSGERYLKMFDEIFRFDFTAGTANRDDILMPNSGIFEFKSNATLKVQNPFNIRVYR